MMCLSTALRCCVVSITLVAYEAARTGKVGRQIGLNHVTTSRDRHQTPFDPEVLAKIRSLKGPGHFSVLTFNLWGQPRKGDDKHVLKESRVRNSMDHLMAEVSALDPWVVGFQEYSTKAFDKHLEHLWEQYSGCPVLESAVRIGVRKDVECRVGKVERFAELPDCAKLRDAKYARKYQNVEIKVDSTWVTVAVLHLMSGQGKTDCKMASLGHSFKNSVEENRPGIIMGDMNWFASHYGTERERSHPISRVPYYRYFSDAAALDGRATFPAWDPDLKNPTSRHAARLDRVFYAHKFLETEAYQLVNKKVSGEGKEKYAYISDHVGSFVDFKLLESPLEILPEPKWTKEFAEAFSIGGDFPWHLA